MDKELLTYVLDQAVGVVIAVILLTRIERRHMPHTPVRLHVTYHPKA